MHHLYIIYCNNTYSLYNNLCWWCRQYYWWCNTTTKRPLLMDYIARNSCYVICIIFMKETFNITNPNNDAYLFCVWLYVFIQHHAHII